MRTERSPMSFLVIAIVLGTAVTSLRNRTLASSDAPASDGFPGQQECRDGVPPNCAGGLLDEAADPEIVLQAAETCRDVGYLCVGLEPTGSQRFYRWPDTTGRLRIRIPLPSGETPSRARELQRAAVRGIQYWNQKPFELIIDSRSTSSQPADITISWGSGLSGSQLGITRIQWSVRAGKHDFKVLGMSLATRSPSNPRYELTTEQVLLTAAHEMGHALGLPHSDSERDVMYPTNTARSLTSRDFRTLDALYGLPNGAEIVR